MGKKAKKGKVPKEKRAVISSPGKTIAESDQVANSSEHKLSCPHISQCLNLFSVLEKLGSSEPLECVYCREAASDKRDGRANKNRGKKSNSIWICLECGCFLCGGIGLPISTQCHAIRHTRLTKHPLVIQFENPNLRWCFTCQLVVKIPKSKDNAGVNDALSDVVKIIKKRSAGEQCINAEDGGESKLENNNLTFGYAVRGLINLGNTCFFNSVLQNLLSIGILRNYFTTIDGSLGSLTIAMKKLFSETSAERGIGNIMNPKSVFGSLCSKVPRFRGYKQHDSHELLQCLLDELFTEEMKMNQQNSSKKHEKYQTIVDDIFKGQTLSTVCCMECGHSSTVVEPFLDISLSVPSGDRTMLVSNSKKATMLSNKGRRRVRAKFCSSSAVPAQVTTKASGKAVKYSESKDNDRPCSSDYPCMNKQYSESIATVDNSCTSTNEAKIITESVVDEKMVVSESNDFAWLDYTDDRLEKETVQDSESMVTKDVEFSSDCDEGTDLAQKLKSELSLDKSSNISLTETEGAVQRNNHALIKSGEDDILNLDGFSELFNGDDTEVPINGTIVNKIQPGTCSDSDSDEIGHTDSPVSLENCLDYFTKPEILTNEHSWNCENCAKLLKGRNSNAVGGQTKVASESCTSKGKCSLEKNGHIDFDKSSHDSAKCNGTINNFTEIRYNRMDPTINSSSEGAQDEKSEVSHPSSCHRDFSSTDHNQNDNHICNDCEPSCSVEWRINETLPQNSEYSGISGESEENGYDEINSFSEGLKKDATKRILIKKAPSVLIIHLKRFRQDARGRLNKLKGHINFGDTINLKPYMDIRSGEGGCEYSLTGVVEHSGTMRGGHYVAYVKGKEENRGVMWYHVSDTHVRKASLPQVLSSEAYILFYQKSSSSSSS